MKTVSLFALFLIISLFSFAQQKSIIKLLDAQTKLPITDATWNYGDQNGISNEDGRIELEWKENLELDLSHLSYGIWSLNANEIKAAINSGIITKQENIKSFQPVMVLSLHGTAADGERFMLGGQDRLAHDAGALLSRTPAISTIKKSGSYGFDPVLRGFKYDQLNIVIDGVQCASAACPNRMDPPISQISPNMIEQVEVMKGPYSLRFGNSFGGTINFKTGDPKFSAARTTFGRVTGNYETNGSIARSEAMIGTRGKRYEVSLFGAYSTGQDYTDGEGVLIPAGFMRGSVGANLGFAINSQQFLTATITRNLARDTDFPALPMDLRSDDTWLGNASHKIVFQDKSIKAWKTNVYATMVDHVMDNYDKVLEPRMADAITYASTLNYGGRTETELNVGGGNLFAGADFRNELVEGIRERVILMGPMKGKTPKDNPWQKGQVTKAGVFAEYQVNLNDFDLSVSSRLEYNNAQALDADESFSQHYSTTSATQINPGISIGANKSLSEDFSVGLWLGRAQRSASITERYINLFPVGLDPYEMLGNPELLPEVNNQADFKFDFKTSSTAVELTVFAAYLNNYISSEIRSDLNPRMATSPGVRQFKNVGEALMTGTEISWSQKLFAGLTQYAAVAYTYGQNLVTNSALPEIAPLDFRYTLVGNYMNGKLVPQVTLRHVLKQDRISMEYGETETPAFTLVDLSMNYKPWTAVTFTAGAQNLFDVAYYEHLSRSVKGMNPRPIYAPGRNVFLAVSFDLR